MWLAGTAMLILSLGYLLLVVVSGKARAGSKDHDEPRKSDAALNRKN
jgi:hypothetical protein